MSINLSQITNFYAQSAPESLFALSEVLSEPATQPLSQILYRIHSEPQDLSEVFTNASEITSGVLHTVGSVEQTLNFCRDELAKANYTVTQLGRHKLLGCKSQSDRAPFQVQDLLIELLIEQSESNGTLITYSLSAQ